MSDLSDSQIEYQLFISRAFIYGPYSIVVYDYFLTIGDEVDRFWNHGGFFTFGTALFAVNRYITLFGTVPIVAEFTLSTTDPAKDLMQSYHQYFALLSQLLVAIMLVTRTYALYERNKKILAFLVVVTLAAFIFGLAMVLVGSNANTLSAHLEAFRCPAPSGHPSNIRIAAAWAGMLVFDIIIFGLTVFKALRYRNRAGLFTVLLRDGSMYFAVMMISNACNIGSYVLGGPFISGVATTLTNVLSSVLISRLMLNLRDPAIRQRIRSSRSRAGPSGATISSREPDSYEEWRVDSGGGQGSEEDIALDTLWMEGTEHWAMGEGEGDAAYREGWSQDAYGVVAPRMRK